MSGITTIVIQATVGYNFPLWVSMKVGLQRLSLEISTLQYFMFWELTEMLNILLKTPIRDRINRGRAGRFRIDDGAWHLRMKSSSFFPYFLVHESSSKVHDSHSSTYNIYSHFAFMFSVTYIYTLSILWFIMSYVVSLMDSLWWFWHYHSID